MARARGAIEWTRSRSRAEVVERLESIIQKRGRNEDDSIVQYWTSTTVATPRGRLRDEDFQSGSIGWCGPVRCHPARSSRVNIYTNEFQPASLATGS